MISETKVPNCRMVSSRFFKTAGYSALSDSRFRVLFAAIVATTDAYGNILADPTQLADLAPSENLTPENVEQALAEFHENRLAFRYRTGVCSYLHVMKTCNVPKDAPQYPLAPGLKAVKTPGKSKCAKHDILDEAGHNCDLDGNPLDGQNPRTAPDWFELADSAGYPQTTRDKNGYSGLSNIRKRNRKEMNIPFSGEQGRPRGR